MSTFKDLTDESLQKFQMYYKNFKFGIIDEMSMVGTQLLHLIDRGCRDMFPNVDESFGGLYVYMCGDFRWFLPVKDSPLYNKIFADTMCGQKALIFQKVVEFGACDRQSTDVEF